MHLTHRTSRGSESDEVQLDFLIAVLHGPEIERPTRNFIHERNGEAEAGAIDGLQIMFARITRVDPQVVKRRRLKVPETTFVLFATIRTQDAPKGPRRQARPTQELAAPAVGVSPALQDGQLRCAAAE